MLVHQRVWRDTPVSVGACPPRALRHRLLARTTAGAVQGLAAAGDSLAQEIETPEKTVLMFLPSGKQT